MKPPTTALLAATLAVAATALLAIPPLDASTVPSQARSSHGPHEASGGVRLTIEPVEASQDETRLDVRATTELDVAFLRVEVQLPDGGRLRSADLPDVGPLSRGAHVDGHATVVRPGGAPALAVVRAAFGLQQPDGSIEVLAKEEVIELGGTVPLEGVRSVRSGSVLTLDVPAKHTPAGGAR